MNVVPFVRPEDKPVPVGYDETGTPLFKFLLNYRMDDKTFGIDILAYSFEDAERRVEFMKQNLSVDGIFIEDY